MPDPSQVQHLASSSSSYLLAVVVFTLAGVLVWVFRSAVPQLLTTYRQDMADKRREFVAELNKLEEDRRAEIKEFRTEFTTALREVVAEHKQSTAAIVARLERIEVQIIDRTPQDRPK